MNVANVMQYLSYGLMGVGILAFLVRMIAQVIEEMPGVSKTQMNVITLVVSFVLCPLSVVIACQYFKIVLTWYYVAVSFIAAFVVYLVSTGGWARIYKMWEKTRYKGKKDSEDE